MQDIINMAALTIVAIFIYMFIYGRIMNAKRRSGKIKPRALIEMACGKMLVELQQRGYKEWGLGSLKTFRSIDDYIEQKKEKYAAEELANDTDFILHCGSLVGELIRMKKHFHWKFSDDGIPYLTKKDAVVFPFQLVKQKIIGDCESMYAYSQLVEGAGTITDAQKTNVIQDEVSMESLYALATLWAFGLCSENDYNGQLDSLFLKNPDNAVLLELEECSSSVKNSYARLYHYFSYEAASFDEAAFGRTFFHYLQMAYESDRFGIVSFNEKCCGAWELLPDSIRNKKPFYRLIYADECLAYGDEKQAREVYERAFSFYIDCYLERLQ